jgi:hypothetical protein
MKQASDHIQIYNIIYVLYIDIHIFPQNSSPGRTSHADSVKAKPLSDTDGRGCVQALSDAELFYGTEASKDGKTFFIKVHTRHKTALMLCVHDSGLLGTEGVSRCSSGTASKYVCASCAAQVTADTLRFEKYASSAGVRMLADPSRIKVRTHRGSEDGPSWVDEGGVSHIIYALYRKISVPLPAESVASDRVWVCLNAEQEISEKGCDDPRLPKGPIAPFNIGHDPTVRPTPKGLLRTGSE